MKPMTPDERLADERRMFQDSVRTLGDGSVLRAIASSLWAMQSALPKEGSFAYTLRIFSEELRKVEVEYKAIRKALEDIDAMPYYRGMQMTDGQWDSLMSRYHHALDISAQALRPVPAPQAPRKDGDVK